jgi:hypothetical protein
MHHPLAYQRVAKRANRSWSFVSSAHNRAAFQTRFRWWENSTGALAWRPTCGDATGRHRTYIGRPCDRRGSRGQRCNQRKCTGRGGSTYPPPTCPQRKHRCRRYQCGQCRRCQYDGSRLPMSDLLERRIIAWRHPHPIVPRCDRAEVARLERGQVADRRLQLLDQLVLVVVEACGVVFGRQ